MLLFLASIITLAGIIPYARDIIRGNTKPNITSWITWTLLTTVATIAEFADGEYITGLFTTSAVLTTGIIVILGLKYGYTKYSYFDIFCQIGALMGFLLWYIFNSPALAVIASVAIDFIGALPTIRHSLTDPSEETWTTYALAGIGGIFALGAITSYNFTSLSYPVYIVFINLLLSIIIFRGKNRLIKHAKTT